MDGRNQLRSEQSMVEDCVIVGGGIAGLSAANQLANAGLSPLIIEAGKFPSHKICGEFISHECLPILDQWGIKLSDTIGNCRFIYGENKTEFQLPIPSGSCSRYNFDSMLLDRAQKHGARALTETSVTALSQPYGTSGVYEIVLSNGQTIHARNLMIGTGRIPKLNQSQKAPVLKYFGFKAHFENIDIGKSVEMHLFPGGYLGISNINSQTTNIACIVKKDVVAQYGGPDGFMEHLQDKKMMSRFKQRMAKARMIYPKWLAGQVPEFGVRSNSPLNNVYWIGDSAGSIPPVCGDGLAIAVTSGCLAADCFMQSNAIEFKKEWAKRYHRRFFYAKYIHKIMTTPGLKTVAIGACNLFPQLPKYLWSETRDNR